MTREEQLQVWEAEIAALSARIREGVSVVGKHHCILLSASSLDCAQDLLRLSQGLSPLTRPTLDIPVWP